MHFLRSATTSGPVHPSTISSFGSLGYTPRCLAMFHFHVFPVPMLSCIMHHDRPLSPRAWGPSPKSTSFRKPDSKLMIAMMTEAVLALPSGPEKREGFLGFQTTDAMSAAIDW